MADDRTPGTPDPITGTADKADGSVEDRAGGSGETQPTAEELYARLQEREAELSKLKNTNAQLLSEKSSVEDERRRLREGQPRETPSPADGWMERLQRVRRAAEDGDPVAELELARLELDAHRELENEARWALLKVPEAHREETQKYFAGGDFRTVQAAYRAVLGELALQGKGSAPKPEKTLAQRAREEDDEVGTAMRGLSTTQLQERTMKRDAYNAKLDALPDGPIKAKLIRDVDNNKIQLTD